MSNNVNVGGVPTKTLDVGGYHTQYYLPLEAGDAPTVTAVAALKTVVTLVAATSAPTVRRGLIIYNGGNTILYVKYGSGATLSLYTIPIAPGGAWEMPMPPNSGIITGIWDVDGLGADPTGSAMVTQLTSTGA